MGTRVLSRRCFLGAGATAGLAMTGVGLSGCGLDRSGEMGDAERADITVWTWPDNDQMFLQAMPRFNRAFPNINVTVQGFGGEGGLDINAKLLGALVSGEGPDVAMVEIAHVAKFKSKPGFVDLSKPPFEASKLRERYAEFAWKYAVADSGRLFALPKSTGPGGMFYRRDVFANAGLPTDPDEVHELFRTWEDVSKSGRKVIRRNEQWLLDEPVETVNAIRGQSGLSYFDESGHPLLDDPVVHDALEFVIGLVKDGVMSSTMTEQERGAALNSGSIATAVSAHWFGGLLKNQYAPTAAGKWGVTFAPEKDGVFAFNTGGDFIGILESSQNKAAAWTFISWVTQSSASLQTMYSRDLYPAWLPVIDEKWINDPDPYYGNQNVSDIFGTVTEQVKPPVTHPLDSVAQTSLENAVNDAVAGVMTPKKALRRAQNEVEAEMT